MQNIFHVQKSDQTEKLRQKEQKNAEEFIRKMSSNFLKTFWGKRSGTFWVKFQLLSAVIDLRTICDMKISSENNLFVGPEPNFENLCPAAQHVTCSGLRVRSDMLSTRWWMWKLFVWLWELFPLCCGHVTLRTPSSESESCRRSFC